MGEYWGWGNRFVLKTSHCFICVKFDIKMINPRSDVCLRQRSRWRINVWIWEFSEYPFEAQNECFQDQNKRKSKWRHAYFKDEVVDTDYQVSKMEQCTHSLLIRASGPHIVQSLLSDLYLRFTNVTTRWSTRFIMCLQLSEIC